MPCSCHNTAVAHPSTPCSLSPLHPCTLAPALAWLTNPTLAANCPPQQRLNHLVTVLKHSAASQSNVVLQQCQHPWLVRRPNGLHPVYMCALVPPSLVLTCGFTGHHTLQTHRKLSQWTTRGCRHTHLGSEKSTERQYVTTKHTLQHHCHLTEPACSDPDLTSPQGPGTYEPENAAASLKFSKHGGSSFGGPHATTDRFAPQPDEKEKALTPVRLPSPCNSPLGLAWPSLTHTTVPAACWVQGPGTYAGTSALGKQALSKQRTAQASRFGSSGRESAAKVWRLCLARECQPHALALTPRPFVLCLQQYFAGMMEAPAVSQVAAQPDDVTPGPGQYSVAASSAFTPTGVAGRTNAASPSPSFGGNLARVDRSTTGALAHTAKAADLPVNTHAHLNALLGAVTL